MDAKNIQKLVEKGKNDILQEVQDRLPRKVGVIAVNHFKQNFRDGGWLDNGLHPWKKTLRQKQGGREAKYGPLTSRRNHMMRSIQSRPGVGEVTIRLNVQLLIDCYDYTHHGSSTMEAIRQRAAMVELLHHLLQGYRPKDDGVMISVYLLLD